LHLTYILNPGAAFGILENQRFFFILIAVILIFAIVYFYSKIIKLNKLFQLGIAMLFSGAIGNMIDRIFIGKVIDYIDFRIWPIFNLADIAIVCGCIIIIYELLFITDKGTNS
jgi:signal peptidase II